MPVEGRRVQPVAAQWMQISVFQLFSVDIPSGTSEVAFEIMPPGSNEPTEQGPGIYAPLKSWQRIVFGVFGFGGLGAGGTSTFITNNSAGSGVLLALGALFLLIAVTGNPITRAKFGDYEVGLGYKTVVAEILESSEQNVQQTAAEAVLGAPLPPNDPIRRRAQVIERAIEYEERVSLALHRIFGSGNVHRFREGPDFEIRFQQQRVGIEVKHSAKPRSSAVTAGIDQALSYLSHSERGQLDGIVIVTNFATPADLERVSKHSRIALMIWNSEEDDVAIRREVERLAAAP